MSGSSSGRTFSTPALAEQLHDGVVRLEQRGSASTPGSPGAETDGIATSARELGLELWHQGRTRRAAASVGSSSDLLCVARLARAVGRSGHRRSAATTLVSPSCPERSWHRQAAWRPTRGSRPNAWGKTEATTSAPPPRAPCPPVDVAGYRPWSDRARLRPLRAPRLRARPPGGGSSPPRRSASVPPCDRRVPPRPGAARRRIALIVAYPPARFERTLDVFLPASPTWLDPVWGRLLRGARSVGDRLAWRSRSSRAAPCGLPALGAVARRPRAHARLARGSRSAAGPTRATRALHVDERQLPRARASPSARADPRRRPAPRPTAAARRSLDARPRHRRRDPLGGRAGEREPRRRRWSRSSRRRSFGSRSERRRATPRPEDVLAALAELGIADRGLEPAARQPAGVFVARGADVGGASRAREGLRARRVRHPAPREGLAHDHVPGRRPAAAAQPPRGGRARGTRHSSRRARPAWRRARSSRRPSPRPGTPLLVFRERARPLAGLPRRADDDAAGGAGDALTGSARPGSPTTASTRRRSRSSTGGVGLRRARPRDDRGRGRTSC